MSCSRFGPVENLAIAETAEPALQFGQVRIAVLAAGVNYADALKIEGRYQVRPTLPWIPGTEVGGIVIETARDVKSVRAGMNVMGVSGETGGGFAETIALHEDHVIPLPDGFSTAFAAVIPVTYGTALYSLRQRAQLKAGESVLVLGAAGGAGLAAVGVAKAMGATVIAAASTPEKRQLAIDAGADAAVNYTEARWPEQVRSMVAAKRVDVVFDPVGGNAFTDAERCIGWGGRYLVVGFAGGDIPTVQINRPLVKGYDICGIRYDTWRDNHWHEARQNLEELIEWVSSGRIKPLISARFPMERARDAINSLSSRSASGKVVLVNKHASTND